MNVNVHVLLQVKLNAIQAVRFQETPSMTAAMVSVYVLFVSIIDNYLSRKFGLMCVISKSRQGVSSADVG